MIVLCSKSAISSEWVNKEISAFRECHPEAPILPVILSDSKAETDVATALFPEALLNGGEEPLAADMRKSGDGSNLGFLKLVSALTGVPLNKLLQKDNKRRNRRVTAVTLASSLLVTVMLSLALQANAAEQSSTFRAIALVAPWLHNAAIVEEVYGGVEGVAGLIETGRNAVATEAKTGEPQLIPATGPVGSATLMPGVPYYTEEGLGMIPEWENTFNLASWEGWLTFDGVRAAQGISQPLIIVHSEDAAIPAGAHQFFADLNTNKEELWLDGVTQFDFYHREDAVTVASDAVVAFFADH